MRSLRGFLLREVPWRANADDYSTITFPSEDMSIVLRPLVSLVREVFSALSLCNVRNRTRNILHTYRILLVELFCMKATASL